MNPEYTSKRLPLLTPVLGTSEEEKPCVALIDLIFITSGSSIHKNYINTIDSNYKNYFYIK